MSNSIKTALHRERARSEAALIDGLIEQLSDKRLIDRERLSERAQELGKRIMARPNGLAPEQVVVYRRHLFMVNSAALEVLVDLLIDRGVLEQTDLELLHRKINEKRIALQEQHRSMG